MKTKLTLVIVAILLCGLAVSLVAVEKTGAAPDPAAEVKELRKQVAELKAQVKELEGRLDKFELAAKRRAQPAPPDLRQFGIITNLPPFRVPFPNLPSDRNGRPKIWGGGEINGWPCYFIPCQDK